ncbi:MAG: hypothetical protein EBS19_09415 [Spirochaetia bacterium]|nr:hypothetical protein [Spirochaetia bacterium]
MEVVDEIYEIAPSQTYGMELVNHPQTGEMGVVYQPQIRIEEQRPERNPFDPANFNDEHQGYEITPQLLRIVSQNPDIGFYKWRRSRDANDDKIKHITVRPK